MANETVAPDHPTISITTAAARGDVTVEGIVITGSAFRPVIVKGAANSSDAALTIKTGKP